jgi:hypothetical protein
MVEPPLVAGGFQSKVAVVLPRTPCSQRGTLGTVAGTPLTRDEKVPVSRAFTAATDTRYVVPFARPVITNGPVAVANEVNVTPLSRE